MFGSKFQLENPYLHSEFSFYSDPVSEQVREIVSLGLDAGVNGHVPMRFAPIDLEDVSSEAIVGFAADETNDTLIDHDRCLVYISTSDGRILRYEIASDTFLSSIDIDGTLQGLALSQEIIRSLSLIAVMTEI